MASNEIRVSIGDLDKNGSPEIAVEFYAGTEFDFAVTVSSSKNDGQYDKIAGTVDSDGDEKYNEQEDIEPYFALASAAALLLK